MTTRIAIAQINTTVGDFASNRAALVAAAHTAYAQGARIVVAPELALSGYPPEDLLLRPAFYAQSAAALAQLAQDLASLKGLHVVVGHPYRSGADVTDDRSDALPDANNLLQRPIPHSLPPSDTYNAASVLLNGRIIATYCKEELPNTDVFDERRYFAPGRQPVVVTIEGVRYGILICEDIWHPQPVRRAQQAGAQVLLVLNGSPYYLGKSDTRLRIAHERVRESGLPLIFVNLYGSQDELVFDGGSFVLNAQGVLIMQLPSFEEKIGYVDFDGAVPQPGTIVLPPPLEAQAYAALVLGVRDYVNKNGFPGVLLGLSGGVDSALVLAVACDALGAERVRAVMMPSCYTADISTEDARAMAQRLGVRYDEIAIEPMVAAFRDALAQEFAGLPENVAEENIQARIRGTLLMALSNKHGAIVLTTGNKSEMAVGYCTLYGDMAGGFAVLKDISKTLVYRLCQYRNQSDEFAIRDPIPQRILTRAPSAELRANQTDQDSLPPYDVLDEIMRRFIEEDQPVSEIIAAGFAPDDVKRVTRLIKLNEYKRRQAPVGIRVTHRAFGRDWRYPITSKFSES